MYNAYEREGDEILRVTKSEVRGAYKYYGLFYTGDRVISKEYILKTDNPDEPILFYDYAEGTWHELARNRFLRFRDERMKAGNLDEIHELYALWFLEQHHAFNGEGDDAAVEAFLVSWTEKAKQRLPEWLNMKGAWTAKYVETAFYLKGKKYSITPESIGLSDDAWDAGFMEYLQGDIGEDLNALGAEEIRHMGFLD